jgi:hypothetical protein
MGTHLVICVYPKQQQLVIDRTGIMSHTQQNAVLRPISQPESPVHRLWVTLTPVVVLFAAGLRPVWFVLGQGLLAAAPLMALLGLEDAADSLARMPVEDYPKEHSTHIDGDLATGSRPAQRRTRDG